MREWAARGGGLSALQAVDQEFGAPGAAPRPPAPASSPADVQAAIAPLGGAGVPQATDSEQIPAVRNASLPPAPEPRDLTMRMISEGLGGLAGRPFQADHWARVDAGDAAREQNDPSSRASAIARKRLAPVLLSLGLNQMDIETLSAADMAQMSKGGNLVSSLASARGKAEQSRAAAAARAAEQADARAYGESTDAAKAARDAAEFDRRNAITAPQQMARARAIGGMASARQMQAAAFQADRDARNREASDRSREDADTRRAERERDRQARAARIEMEKEYASAEAAMDALEDKLDGQADDAPLPGDENIASRAWAGVKGKIGGGSGRESDATLLQNDLDLAGSSTFRITTGQVANTEAERADAKRIFRGNGTVASARQAVREMRRKARAAQDARLRVLAEGGTAEEADAAARATGGAVGGNPPPTPEEAELGLEND